MVAHPSRHLDLSNRRNFLQQAAVLTAVATGVANPVRAASANDRLNIAIIGCGGRGGANLNGVATQNIVALCDVNERNLNIASQRFPNAKKFRDFRRMYDGLNDSAFDAVVVSTTEHTHAFATLPALLRKKHVYCEKPLTHNVREARIVANAAKAAGVATQMGTQIHATENYRRVVELVQSGAVGPISEVHVWVSRAWGWQSAEDAMTYQDLISTQERPTEESPVPAELDWDLWLGPAPYRPFNEIYFPGPRWYRWWEWGSGTMSDLGSHRNDLPFWALNLDAPLTVEAAGPPPHPDLAPASMSATYQFAARGDRPAVKMVWYQGNMKPELWTEQKIPQWKDGVLFVGSKGMVLADYSKLTLLPAEDFKDFQPPPKTIPESLGHHAEWLHACQTGAPTTCHFGYSGPLTEANHLGNVAYRAGKKIEWDPTNLRIPNAPDAERFLGREYRSGWSLPSLTT
jgi:predicted dehydrogenase